ncbi:hypothetical protein CALCODRAFT_483180 [Calocera cornea HHB12733]|uniref:Uncharacterized protein n=1 Tax=Calocera cornea HHB12733 TaxID=1353952 RepID=A0A165FY68_9BASI|nr:hypothetical protein CALCODRAFT_483180 [Calocera cornea HHB12733]
MERNVMENPGPPWSTAHDNAQVGHGKDPDVYLHNRPGPRGETGALSGGELSIDDRTNVEEGTASLLDSDSVGAIVRHQHITPGSVRLRDLSPAIRLRDSNSARPRSSAAVVTLATSDSACSAESIHLGPRREFGALSGGDINSDDRTHIEDETASFPNGESVCVFVRHQHITPESACLRGLSPAIRLWDSNTARPRSSAAIVNLATPKSAVSADSDVLTAVTTTSLPRIAAPRSPAPSYRTNVDIADRISDTEVEVAAGEHAGDADVEEDEGDAEEEDEEEEEGEEEEAEEEEEADEEQEEEDEEESEDEEDEAEEEEQHVQVDESLPVYRKHDGLPTYATLLPSQAAPSTSTHPSPPPSPPPKNTTMPFIPTFHIPTRAEVRAVWDEADRRAVETVSPGLQTPSNHSSASAKRTPRLFSLFKHSKNNRPRDLVIPPLHL